MSMKTLGVLKSEFWKNKFELIIEVEIILNEFLIKIVILSSVNVIISELIMNKF